MKIAVIASEVAPFAKTGGLGDVAAALPKALAALGAEVVTICPLYQSVRSHPLEKTSLRLWVPLGNQGSEVHVFRSGNNYFLEYDPFYHREGLYGTPQGDYKDNASRFIFFSRGALELLRELGVPDVIHAHDWQTGLVPIYVKTLYAEAFPRTRTVLTIHNLAYQGLFGHWDMPLTSLGWKHFNWRDMEFYGNLSFLKAGIVHADALTTVSPTYAREIQEEAFGCGLHGVLRERAIVLHGILNGIDAAEWNPETDRHIATSYSGRSPAGKAECKAALQKRSGLAPRADVPLIGMIGRLTEQKGMDIFVQAVDALAAEDIQMVILSSGEGGHQDALAEAVRRHSAKISLHIAFDDALAHQIEAGSDMFLMPSRYEPCGLNQMYSFRYGSVPVVRATGGLADTVKDGVTGFSFHEYTSGSLLGAMRRALKAYADRKTWKKLVVAGMKQDFSWEASARKYLSLFESLSGA